MMRKFGITFEEARARSIAGRSMIKKAAALHVGVRANTDVIQAAIPDFMAMGKDEVSARDMADYLLSIGAIQTKSAKRDW